MLLAPYLRKYGKFTVPEFIGDRFYSKGAPIVAVICLIICLGSYVIGQMKGVGVAFSRFLEVKYEVGLFDRYVYRILLRSIGWNERDYLHTDRTVLCIDFGLHHSGHLHLLELNEATLCHS